MPGITITAIDKFYDNGFHAVKGMDLEIHDREFMVLVGPSGCGKTTTLRMIAGLEDITRGTISIGDRVINEVQPKDRDIAMVFQNYALYPHMTVYENLAYGLKLRRMPKAEIDVKVRKAAGMLGLDSQLAKRPKQLSGGQRQRVALGRAIVRQPKAFLFDEPLSNLDAKLRGDMRFELKTLQQDLATTSVYVTHDQVEAMTLGDRITVMNDGLIQQVAAPTVLYDHPWNRFVAGFIGQPQMNFLRGSVEAHGDGHRFIHPLGGPLPLLMPHAGNLATAPSSGSLLLGIRPEHFADGRYVQVAPEIPRLKATVRVVEVLGDHQYVYLVFTGAEAQEVMIMKNPSHHTARPGDEMEVIIDTTQAHVFAGEGDDAPNLVLPPDFARQQ